jgi:DNA-binding response OmpR family regulator
MRGLSRTKRVPVIILSATSVDEENLAGAEVEAVFTKPVAALPLFEAIDRAIKRSALAPDDAP